MKPRGLKIDVSDSFNDVLLGYHERYGKEFAGEMDDERFVSLARRVNALLEKEEFRYLMYRFVAAAYTAREAAVIEQNDRQRLNWQGRLDALKQLILPLPDKIKERADEIERLWKSGEREKRGRGKVNDTA